MCDNIEKTRIVDAKSRITKFTLDNRHLTNMIDKLKEEIKTLEVNKVRLLSELEEPDLKLPEREHDVISTPQMDLIDSSQTTSLTNISDINSISSINSESIVDEDDDSNYDSNSPGELEDPSIDNKEEEITDKVSSENMKPYCVNCVESLLSNLRVLKECLRTNHCLDCRQLRNGIYSLQEMDFNKRHSYNSSSDASISTSLSSLFSMFNFMSIPLLVLFICGYFGVLVYTKQANSYLLATPPQ